jgi:hypothetical protein
MMGMEALERGERNGWRRRNGCNGKEKRKLK